MGPIPTGVHQIAISCKDVAVATAFYRDVVGCQFLFESNGIAFLMCGNVRLMLGPPAAADVAQPLYVYLSTNDIGAAAKSLEAKGAKLEGQPHIVAKLPGREVWLVNWRDTEGNLMAFMQEKPA